MWVNPNVRNNVPARRPQVFAPFQNPRGVNCRQVPQLLGGREIPGTRSFQQRAVYVVEEETTPVIHVRPLPQPHVVYTTPANVRVVQQTSYSRNGVHLAGPRQVPGADRR